MTPDRLGFDLKHEVLPRVRAEARIQAQTPRRTYRACDEDLVVAPSASDTGSVGSVNRQGAAARESAGADLEQPVEARGLCLPVLALPNPGDANETEGRYAASNLFAGFAAGGTLAWAARRAGLPWWWLNVPVGLLDSMAASLGGFALPRGLDWIDGRTFRRSLRRDVRFFVRFFGTYAAAVYGFDVLSARLERRSLWTDSWRWSPMIGFPLLVFLLITNAQDAQAHGRLALARAARQSARARGLRNDVALAEDMEHLRRVRAPFTFVYFDLDGFKQVNDARGHDVGNEILGAVGLILERPDVVGYHLHGDEYAVLIPGHLENELLRIVHAVSRQIIDLGVAQGVALGATFGAAWGPSENEDPRRNADQRMLRAKGLGRRRLITPTDQLIGLGE